MEVKKYRGLLRERLDIGTLATFVPNKNVPVYDWFYYKEGYSRDLVFMLAEKFGLKPGSFVLDPFCGSGTTLLACMEMGINSYGFDVLPVSVFASQVKTCVYNGAELKKCFDYIFRQRFFKPQNDMPADIQRFFNVHSIDDINFFHGSVAKINDVTTKNLFMLGLVNAAMKVSYVWKDGGVLKVKKHPVPPFSKLYYRTMKRMVKEALRSSGDGRAVITSGDARRLNLPGECVDAVITSPPYLNNIDYTKVYLVENWFAAKAKPALRSCISLGESLTDDSVIFSSYFTDMKQTLSEMHRVLKPGGNAAIIVGDAYMNDKVADVDLRLAAMGEELGFKAHEIIVLNKRFALKNRTQKVGVLRESIVILEKPK